MNESVVIVETAPDAVVITETESVVVFSVLVRDYEFGKAVDRIITENGNKLTTEDGLYINPEEII